MSVNIHCRDPSTDTRGLRTLTLDILHCVHAREAVIFEACRGRVRTHHYGVAR